MRQKSWLNGLRQNPFSTPDSVQDTPAFEQLQHLFLDAIQKQATDMHFDPKLHHVLIRMRVDGHLQELASIPLLQFDTWKRIIKLRSRLNIAENRLPQEGGFTLDGEPPRCDIRVSFMPTILGEKCSLRFLPVTENLQTCTDLGLTREQSLLIEQTIANREGSVIISGPTGSGKSTTLHTLLSLFPKKSLQIISIEDPVEIRDEEINQVQVQEDIGLTYQHLLKKMMRLDPDVFLLGEVRDRETARIACEAALTGHFFLTTIHTKSTFDILLRLLEMGIEPYLIASSLSVLISERLVRKVCPFCAEKTPIEIAMLKASGIHSQWVGKGCDHCRYTGYHGRIGVFEVAQISKGSKKLIADFGLHPDLDRLQESFRHDCPTTLQYHMMCLIRKGVTNWEEVLVQTDYCEFQRESSSISPTN